MVADGSSTSVQAGSLQSIQEVARTKQAPQREAPFRRAPARFAETVSRPADPADVTAAAQRLDKLLARDGDTGPRPDAPPRGYYLNIIV